MIFQNSNINKIILPESEKEALLNHCLRKFNQQYVEGEVKERKAYGLIGGKVVADALHIGQIAPLYKNSRAEGEDKKYMDGILNEFAEASETPLERRGWVADAEETFQIFNEFSRSGLDIVAAYHMHRVAWENDPTREKPSALDTELAKGSGLFAFIISLIDPERPIIRAFYEGYPDQELPIVIG
jgi:hypothetical protein